MDRVAVLNTYTAPKKKQKKLENHKKKGKKANKKQEWIGSIVLKAGMEKKMNRPILADKQIAEKAGMKAFSEWKDGPILTDKQIAAEEKKMNRPILADKQIAEKAGMKA
eukprot:242417_1